MNPVTDIVFSLTWVLLLIWAIRSLSKGWNAIPQNKFGPSGTWTTQVTKRVHPEMEGVEPGTELLGVNFEEKPTSCDLEEYRALQDRIEELKLQLEDDDDDDDDDGDVPALLKR